MIPIFIGIGLTTLILFKRDLFTMLYFSGLLLNRVCNSIIKKYLKQHRPNVPNRPSPEDFGMPSDHAQFMGFFLSFSALLIILRLGERSMRRSIRIILLTVCTMTTVLTCYSRIYLQYHTVAQVLVGTVVGAVLGAIWFYNVHCASYSLFPRLCNSRIGQLFLIQDFTPIPNLLKFEYNNARSICLSNSNGCQTKAFSHSEEVRKTHNGEPKRTRSRNNHKD
ncbi:Dolichyldiphosphatase [Fasciolopsis buskii]|uniref:Dolichyldiphosphatase 1 n=1 Tax=Fasciolopsis buskii TaxID=27845 RepID=A0A8E0S4J2_9TREM|nr:Dolichyldiphosphatase [Fasciolopsis buski]